METYKLNTEKNKLKKFVRPIELGLAIAGIVLVIGGGVKLFSMVRNNSSNPTTSIVVKKRQVVKQNHITTVPTNISVAKKQNLKTLLRKKESKNTKNDNKKSEKNLNNMGAGCL